MNTNIATISTAAAPAFVAGELARVMVAGQPQFVVGAELGGGYFAGVIMVGGEKFALVVSPKAEGSLVGAWISTRENVSGAEHYSDGFANTEAMAAAGSALARDARALTIAGFDDWYIPSRDELELVYRNLKPVDDENGESFRDGDNPSSVPVGYPYTAVLPAQTTADAFKDGGSEALDSRWHWSSTQYAPAPSNAWYQYFYDGSQYNYNKSAEGRARAVRRLPI
jgi:hypothetical protein